ncbi:FHA domain-containing protein [Brevibacillus dissolubilis]|uniref:FHA domain-containing protein n=1 Tax=Brevibacillus dissolubilis TaxID=1844116 RepID=UPI001C3F2301|nr:FHA domain-containing protein [Brevibacillus dissolubilis]
MSMVQCANGHFFDPGQSASCPHCDAANHHLNSKTSGHAPNQNHPIHPANPAFDPWDAAGIGKTQPAPFHNPNDQEAKTAPLGYNGAPNPIHPASDDAKTIGAYMKKKGADPVVGWLVCIKGPDRGRDYRIHTEKNRIGRSENNDIHIRGDNAISRENHATITYDPKKKRFRLLAGESRGMVYLNDEAVDLVADLTAYDIIEMGDTQLMFVPLCGDRFDWD